MQLPDASFGNISFAAILIGVAATFWSKLKTMAWRVANLFVVKMSVSGFAEAAVRGWLWRNGKRSLYGERVYTGEHLMVRKYDRRMLVGSEALGPDTIVFWVNGWKPILATVSSHSYGGNNNSGIHLTLMFIRGMFDPDKLVETAINDANNRRSNSVYRRFTSRRATGTRGVMTNRDRRLTETPATSAGMPMEKIDETDMSSRRFLGYSIDEIGPPIPEDPMGYLAIQDDLSPVLESMRRWLKMEKWYKRRSIPWRMGVAFVGPPGCGKTSTAKAIAQELDLPITAFELATFTDQDMILQWHNLQYDSPCIVLIEDIDTVFHGRDNIADGDEPGLTFGCLLNCLSGIEGADGILTIVTTNRPETLDEALGRVDGSGRSSRPGRIDRVVELRHLDEKGRRHIAARILEDCPDEIEAAVSSGRGESGAQFTQRCSEIAMRRLREAEESGSVVEIIIRPDGMLVPPQPSVRVVTK